MKLKKSKPLLALMSALLVLSTGACSSQTPSETSDSSQNETASGTPIRTPGSGGTSQDDTDFKSRQGQDFTQAHDAFQTKLAREENDSDSVYEPPEGLFDLVYYPSKVGDLAAYVSSDPGDGEKHPLIIWVVGGWGNGIDDFPFCYPQWDNDQTGSAFWQSGVLTMYPSFRGGNGNPGYYEALYGEVDDIAAAYEYAASLPYVDPDRIYLGGHSTGGTRALLAAEYTDKFRSVFCFGAVDEIKYHNNTQFTFDTSDTEEFVMRSPVYWLDNIDTPTFLIEGEEGNSASLRNIQKVSENDNIHCYILDNADHFSALGPVTWLLARKILEDTGAEPGISITQEELEAAMAQDPMIPLPAMTRLTIDGLNMAFSCPYIWQVEDSSEEGLFRVSLYSAYEDDNIWDMATLYLSVFAIDNDAEYEGGYLQEMARYLEEEQGYETVRDATIAGQKAITALGTQHNDNGSTFRNLYALLQKDDYFVEFDFYIHEGYGDDGDPLFDAILESVEFLE